MSDSPPAPAPHPNLTPNLPPGTQLVLRVPASTSNLGPGFDVLGLALTLYADYTFTVLEEGQPNRFKGQGGFAGITASLAAENPLFAAMDHIARAAGRRFPPVAVVARGRVPVGKGLGASAVGAVAGALACNALVGSPFTREALLAHLIELEGHPDNVTPSLLGGLTLTAQDAAGPLVHLYECDAAWRVALLIPDYATSTPLTRAALPKKVRRSAAVFNLARVPLVIDALVAGDAATLGRALQDKLHEKPRGKLIKRRGKIRAAALEASAAAVFISGSGPTLAAFCKGPAAAKRVAAAMLAACEGANFGAQALVVGIEPHGAMFAEDEGAAGG
jgi:homoserine kinase